MGIPLAMLFSIADQLNGSFEELMDELRAIRRELEQIRNGLGTERAPLHPVAGTRSRSARKSKPAIEQAS
jgi:hypothetical protein